MDSVNQKFDTEGMTCFCSIVYGASMISEKAGGDQIARCYNYLKVSSDTWLIDDDGC